MDNFEYHRPAKLADAVKLIKAKKDGKLMSGGMTLIPTMKQRLAAPSDIIDLSGLNNYRRQGDEDQDHHHGRHHPCRSG
jgi:aerobic carbon-monoxide dehydrogenase medium subunit